MKPPTLKNLLGSRRGENLQNTSGMVVRTETYGVKKDKELKFEDIEASHILGGVVILCLL